MIEVPNYPERTVQHVDFALLLNVAKICLKFNLKFYVNYEFGKDFLRKLELRKCMMCKGSSCEGTGFLNGIDEQTLCARKDRSGAGFINIRKMKKTLQHCNFSRMGAAW